jgi:hypothetical protein
MTARRLPYRHLSVRVPWHDTGWEGSICNDPLANGACLRLGRIAEGRNDSREVTLAGKAWGDIAEEDLPPCSAERAGFMSPHARRVTKRQLFAGLGSHRDRALVAFWVSTGARAAELLGARRADADPGQQLITVIRKGTRALQPLPASPDAFVWLRLYQAQMHGLIPAGPDDPLWWTLRRPFRPLSYHAARAMFTRAGAALGARWRLHDLRHILSA